MNFEKLLPKFTIGYSNGKLLSNVLHSVETLINKFRNPNGIKPFQQGPEDRSDCPSARITSNGPGRASGRVGLQMPNAILGASGELVTEEGGHQSIEITAPKDSSEIYHTTNISCIWSVSDSAIVKANIVNKFNGENNISAAAELDLTLFDSSFGKSYATISLPIGKGTSNSKTIGIVYHNSFESIFGQFKKNKLNEQLEANKIELKKEDLPNPHLANLPFYPYLVNLPFCTHPGFIVGIRIFTNESFRVSLILTFIKIVIYNLNNLFIKNKSY